jgi:hypothetical protein
LHRLQGKLAPVRSDIKLVLDGHPIRHWKSKTERQTLLKKCIETRDLLNELIVELSAPLAPDPPPASKRPFELPTGSAAALPKPME